MATFTINIIADNVDGNYGELCLREAVTLANATMAADKIVFARNLEGQTLTLTDGELVLRQDVAIDGDQNNDGVQVTLSGGGVGRILRTSGNDAALEGLTLTHGQLSGGAVFVGGGSLDMMECTVRDSATSIPHGIGGGIFVAAGSRVTISDSAFLHNTAHGPGGGIATDSDVTLVIRNSEFFGNVGFGYGPGYGGAIHMGRSSSLVLEDCTLSGNRGYSGGAVGLDFNSTAVIDRCTMTESGYPLHSPSCD